MRNTPLYGSEKVVGVEDVDLPALPYPEPDGTRSSGHSGSETSRERALGEDADGTTTKRDRETLDYIEPRRTTGCTVKELREYMGWHHGQASGALSRLHQLGHLVRLTERRDHCLVYVTPPWQEGREESPYKPRGPVDIVERERVAFIAGYLACVEAQSIPRPDDGEISLEHAVWSVGRRKQ